MASLEQLGLNPLPGTGPRWYFNYSGFTFDMPFTGTTVEFDWMVSASLSFLSALAFVFMTVVVFPKIKPSNPETIKTIAYWHYSGLFLFSLISWLAAMYIVFVDDNILSGNLDNFYCQLPPDWFRFLSILFLLSKYWEWIDTAIMIWQGKSIKSIGFLHYYHHMTTVWTFCLIGNFPAAVKLGLLMNGFVHTLMYWHYAFRLPKWCRPIITIAQIIQLFYGTFAWGWNAHHCEAIRSIPTVDPLMYWSMWAFVPVYLAFFLRFFYQAYLTPHSAKPTAATMIAAPTDKQKTE